MKILVTIDFSEISDTVLEQASRLASAMSAQVVLLHVAEPNPDHIAFDYDPAATYAIDPTEIRDNIAQRFHNEHKLLQDYANQLRARSLDCKALMVQGPTVEMILQEADKLGASFIIAGSHGKGVISQILLGSASKELIAKSRIPVMLIPASDG